MSQVMKPLPIISPVRNPKNFNNEDGAFPTVNGSSEKTDGWLSKRDISFKTPSPIKRSPNRSICTQSKDKYCSRVLNYKTPMTAAPSPISYASSTELCSSSFRSNSIIPVTKLSFEYVSTCQSEDELYQISDSLEYQHVNRYPKLLKKVHDRLNEIKTLETSQRLPAHIIPDTGEGVDVASITFDEDESSLVMSVSTTMIEEMSKISPSTPNVNPNTEMAGKIDVVNEGNGEVNQCITKDLQLNKELGLSQEIQELKKQISELQISKHKEESSLQQKLDALESTMQLSEEKIRQLEENAQLSSEEVKSLRLELKNVQAERNELQKKLSGEKIKHTEHNKKLEDTVDSLSGEVATLSEKLNLANSTLALQSQLKQELDLREENEAALKKSLSKVKSLLEASKKDQTSMLNILQEALGRDIESIQNLDQTQRKKLVEEVCTELATSKRTAKNLAQTIASTRDKKKKLANSYKVSESRVKELSSIVGKLETKNTNLTEDVSRLSLQLEMLTSKFKNWKSKETEYKGTIENLQKQLRAQDDLVPSTLYQNAKRSVAEQMEKVKERDHQIHILERDKSSLQGELMDMQNDRIHLLERDIISLQEELKDMHGSKNDTSMQNLKKSDYLQQQKENLEQMHSKEVPTNSYNNKQVQIADKVIEDTIQSSQVTSKKLNPSGDEITSDSNCIHPNNLEFSPDRLSKAEDVDPTSSSIELNEIKKSPIISHTKKNDVGMQQSAPPLDIKFPRASKMGIREKLEKIRRNPLNRISMAPAKQI